MKVSIIGSGNVATVLANLAFDKSHTIVEIIGRNHEQSKVLAQKVNADFSPYKSKIQPVDVVIIALSDTAIASVIENIEFNDSLVVHTAGSISLNVLKNNCKHYGVLYPLQSLNKNVNHTPEIPFLIEANDAVSQNKLLSFANTISNNVQICDEATRLKLHTAAVFVNNFTNFLYTQADNFCKSEKLNFNLLLPLISETANRVMAHNPSTVQTGPAKRKDINTINKHLDVLANHHQMKSIYNFLTKEIMEE
jgi:predicted short-subunit dehydrogenase-like oxidoreductase (DUF2520 family)